MILVFIEQQNGIVKKASLESVTLARQLAAITGSRIEAIVEKNENLDPLFSMGFVQINYPSQTAESDTQRYTKLISDIYSQKAATYLILAGTSLGKSIAGRIAVRLNKGIISGVTGLNGEGAKPVFRKTVFSGKAFANYSFHETSGVITTMPNSFSVQSLDRAEIPVVSIQVELPPVKTKLVSRNLIQGKTPLPEASIVVSAGRGMKDPGNWGMVDELAEILGATTACSRPVADAGWRPHHEHVGQTGIAIRPSVYIAIGISGAIQHLAGVNNSQKIIVINKDAEAPFFKAADYGVCGDLFEIVPKLNAALKQHKS